MSNYQIKQGKQTFTQGKLLNSPKFRPFRGIFRAGTDSINPFAAKVMIAANIYERFSLRLTVIKAEYMNPLNSPNNCINRYFYEPRKLRQILAQTLAQDQTMEYKTKTIESTALVYVKTPYMSLLNSGHF